MSRPHPLSALSERDWDGAWQAEQQVLDGLHAQRGSWLPNVVENRTWGAVRWTSGRPAQAAITGRAVGETFAVFRPGLTDQAVRGRVLEALHDRPPVRRMVGFSLRDYHLRGGTLGALVGGVVGAVAAAVAGIGIAAVAGGAAVGVVIGFGVGGLVAHYLRLRSRAAVLSDTEHVRVVRGRLAPDVWLRLVAAATEVEANSSGRRRTDADPQASEAVHTALWEAAGLLLTSSNYTGIEVLADGVKRLADAHGD